MTGSNLQLVAEAAVEYLRHGQKDKNATGPEGGKLRDQDRPLTAEGEQAMVGLGMGYESPLGNDAGGRALEVVARHSIMERTRQSGQAILWGMDVGDEENVGEDPNLGIDMEEMFSTESFATWKEKIGEGGDEAAVDWYLEHRGEKPDEGTWSPLRVAGGMARSLLETIGELRTNGKNRLEFKISHSGYIEALLMFLAEEEIAKDPVVAEQARFVDMIGGAMEMNQLGARFMIRLFDGGRIEIELVLRGKSYSIDLGKVVELAEEA